jgi:hypothetical protein
MPVKEAWVYSLTLNPSPKERNLKTRCSYSLSFGEGWGEAF